METEPQNTLELKVDYAVAMRHLEDVFELLKKVEGRKKVDESLLEDIYERLVRIKAYILDARHRALKEQAEWEREQVD